MPTDKQKVDVSLTKSALTLAEGLSAAVSDQNAAFLMRANYRAKSAWTEHLPFAFWVIQALRPRSLVELGSHLGTSYFGFCQAVSRFGTDTACYAVDTWQGDEHAGFYGNEVFDTVTAYNTANFSGFSTLIRSTFDEALSYFTDGSVDLLHIDGCHSYDAVRADFESWLPKLSDRGLVLLHDTNVRERDFGVFRLLEEIRKDYPVFEFRHGHGLGVVGVGTDLPDEIRDLLAADKIADRSRDIRKIFSRLGEDCQTRTALDLKTAEAARLEGVITKERERIKVLEDRLTAQQDANAALKAAQTERNAERDADNKAARMVLEENHGKIKSSLMRDHATAQSALKAEHERALAALKVQHEADVARLKQETERLIGENRSMGEKADEMATLIKRHESEIATRDADEQSRQDETGRLQTELATLTRRLLELQTTHDNHAEEASRNGSDLAARNAAVTSNSRQAESDLKQRIEIAIQNAAELIRVFAPDHPSRTSVLLSPGVRALIKKVEAEGIVDTDWYLQRNPDVKEADMAPARHYVLYGAAEKRMPRDMSKPFRK